MNILLVAGEFPPQIGGISDYTAILSHELTALGHQVKVATTRVADTEEQSLQRGVDVRRVIFRWHLAEVKSILGILDEMSPDTIVNLQYGGIVNRRRPMVNSLPLILHMLRPHCRVVVTIHEFRAQRTRWRAWALPMIMSAHGLIFVDPPDRELLLRWTKLRTPRMQCIPIAPNILPVPVTNEKRRIWRQRLGISDDTPIVAFFGGIWPQKGISHLIEAVHSIRRDAVEVCLLIIGCFEPRRTRHQDYENKVRQALREGLMAGWARVIDNAPPKVVSEALHASDVAVFPFVRGARSNNGSLLAAIAHGLPVVTTHGIDTPEGFSERYGVELVPAGNSAALTKCLKDIIYSDEERSSLKARAEKAAQTLSWTSIASMTAAFYALCGAKNVRLHTDDVSLIRNCSRKG